MGKLLNISREEWMKELDDQNKFFEIFGDRLPAFIRDEHAALSRRLGRK